jgi:hypothetical protein
MNVSGFISTAPSLNFLPKQGEGEPYVLVSIADCLFKPEATVYYVPQLFSKPRDCVIVSVRGVVFVQ